jgi:D-beta-D-heptose 7-phosphate kinase/D-beta-D-heptose 1-phosphate adenosyltransferase
MKTLLLTGCFDIVHLGHIKLIQFAKFISDEVIIAIDSDDKVKKDKGESRPFNNQRDRQEFLESIKGVDKVHIFFDEEDLERICKEIRPTYRLVGSDWRGKNIVGQQYCGEVLYFDRIPGYSTTNILERGL